MLTFFRPWAAVVALFFLLVAPPPLWAQEQELISSQAGRYPLRAYLASPAGVGPVRIVVELGRPTMGSTTPRTRAIRIGSSPDSPYAPDPVTPAADSTPKAQAFDGVRVALALDMPDMSAVKPVEVELTSAAPGRYEGDILLTMKGVWRIQFLVTTPDGTARKQATIKVGDQLAPSLDNENSEGGLELCSPEAGADVPVTVHCVPDPPCVGKNRLRIELPSAATLPVMVGVNMPGMAVGIPPTEALQQDDGSYEAEINLPMAGYWQLRLDLNGRALPPFALNAEETLSGGVSRALLFLVLPAVLALITWSVLRRRDLLFGMVLCGIILVFALGLGVLIEGRGSADHSMTMTMDMMAADMGMGHLRAPLPVIEAKVQKAPFVIWRSYPATVVPANETVILAPRSGPLTEMVPMGSTVESGGTLARVGPKVIRAPFRGVVVRGLLATGAEVQNGTPLLVFTDTSKVALAARVPVADRGSISVGMETEAADSERQVARGKIRLVSALNQDGTFEIQTVVKGSRQQGAVIGHDGSVLAPAGERDVFFMGQDVNVQVVMERLPATAGVPKQAVRTSPDGRSSVFVVERIAGHRVVKNKTVTVGAVNDIQFQVLSGLEVGQTIVASVEPSLRDGDLVVPATLGEGVFRSLYVPSMTH